MDPDQTSLEDSDYAEWTVLDLRREIQRRVGVNGTAASPLTKRALNSLVAFLTGGLPTAPAYLYKRGEDRDGSENETLPQTDHIDKGDSGDWRPTRPDLLSIIVEEVDWIDPDDGRRALRKWEYVAVLEVMDENGDQREWITNQRTYQ